MTGFTETYFTPCILVKFEWNNGTTYRYCSTLGFINYNNEIYLDNDTTQGQIISLSDYSEKSGDISTRDIIILQKIELQAIVESGAHNDARVTIIEGNAHGTFTAFNTTYWRITNCENDGGLDNPITFTLSSEALGNMLNKGDNYTYSETSQKYIIGTSVIDTGFRYISAAAKAS